METAPKNGTDFIDSSLWHSCMSYTNKKTTFNARDYDGGKTWKKFTFWIYLGWKKYQF